MAKLNTSDYYDSLTDNDSGIGINYASSIDSRSSTIRLIEPSSSFSSQTRIFSPLSTTANQRSEPTPMIKFPSDGVIERVRPSTMKNSENGKYILCQTTRGTYVAHQTPIVPQWVTNLVEQVERLQR